MGPHSRRNDALAPPTAGRCSFDRCQGEPVRTVTVEVGEGHTVEIGVCEDHADMIDPPGRWFSIAGVQLPPPPTVWETIHVPVVHGPAGPRRCSPEEPCDGTDSLRHVLWWGECFAASPVKRDRSDG